MDISVAVLGLAISAPLLAILSFLIWFHDKRSPFYMAERVGIGGHPFQMVKLRSMIVCADETGVDSTGNSDDRITPIGRWIRRYKADEIPQLWNVLRGDMSLVGPRPNVARETSLYTEAELRLLDVRPGMTDFASIVFSDEGSIIEHHVDPDIAYNQLVRPWKSRLGLFYVDQRSFVLDVQLLVLTVLALSSRDRALRRIVHVLDRRGADPELTRVALREDPLIPTPPPGAAEVVRSRDQRTQHLQANRGLAGDHSLQRSGSARALDEAGETLGTLTPAGGRFDYSQITELPDLSANREQREMAYARYAFSARYAAGGPIVEVACGGGHGLGFLRAAAEGSPCIGIDVNFANLVVAKEANTAVPLIQADGLAIPFRPDSASLLTCIEAIYYFPTPERFVSEAHRVLAAGGHLVLTVPNPHRPGFCPSPGSLHYPDTADLRRLLRGAGFENITIFEAFPIDESGRVLALVELVRRAVTRLHLMPRTMRARSAVKRLLYRDMRPLGQFSLNAVDLESVAEPIPGDETLVTRAKLLFAVGTKPHPSNSTLPE